MKRRNGGKRILIGLFSLLVRDEPIVTAALAVPPSVAGAIDHPERRHEMQRITLKSRTFVVSAVMLATALVAAAFPLIAWAGDGGPHGM